jgi:predicted dehydrogenase
MKQYRLVIVGTGNSVGNHLEAIKKLGERVELVAAVDLSEERVRQFCTENAIPRWYTNLSEMLSQESPDLVCVVTPPATHKDISIECLEAGAWVYCEKPLCASLDEFDAIQAAEARTGCFVSTVFQWRFGSAGKHLKNLIQQEIFGKSLVGICNTLWYRSQDYYNVAWRGNYETEFGGPTMTLGIHLMDLYLWLMGDWQEVRAMTGTLDREILVEDVSMALVRFQNGSMGSIVNSALSPRQETYLRLDFQKVTLEVTTLYRYSNQHWKISLPPNTEDKESLAAWNDLYENFEGSHSQQLGEILDCMDANHAPPVNGDEARRIIEFTASLYKSAWTGQPVFKGEIQPDDSFYYSNNGAATKVKSS